MLWKVLKWALLGLKTSVSEGTAKLELSCKAGSLIMQLTAKLGHPDQPFFPSTTLPPVLKISLHLTCAAKNDGARSPIIRKRKETILKLYSWVHSTSEFKSNVLNESTKPFKFIFEMLPLWTLFSRPGQCQGLLYKQPCDSFIESVITFLPQFYGAATPKRLEIAFPVIK